MLQKWMIVAALVAVLVILVGGMAGYEMGKQNPSVSVSHTTVSYQPSGPSLLEQATMAPDVATAPIEPQTEPIMISALPEAMLQLMTLKEGQSATFSLNGQSGHITKGCYDKWVVRTKAGSKTFESWGDLTVRLYKMALNAKHFALQIHGKMFQISNAGPRLVMRSAQGDSFDYDSGSNPPIYAGLSSSEQTA